MPNPRMPYLARCWLIIESTLIPEGYLKWFYLSFYIHPIFLCFCQIIIWIKILCKWYLNLIHFLCQFILLVSSYCTVILRFLKIFAFLFASPPANEEEEVDDDEVLQIPSVHNQVVVYATAAKPCHGAFSHIETYYDVDSVFEVKLDEINEVLVQENPSLSQLDNPCKWSSSSISNSPASAELSPDHDEEVFIFPADLHLPPLELNVHVVHSDELPPPICIPRLHVESEIIVRNAIAEVDSVYVKYEERMKWFDLLSRDRLHGIDAIQRVQLESPYDKVIRENLVRSLKSDFELVYVAQSCLSWDALHHQYRKVTSDQDRFFCKETAERFQEFHILLERFVEDQDMIHMTGERQSIYVQRRFSHKKLLQVPQVSSPLENDGITEDAVKVEAAQVLKIIEKCIRIFWLFVKAAGTKNSTWKKLKNSLYNTGPPVEDPRNLELLYDLRKILRKKEQVVEILECQKESWWKKAARVEIEHQKVDDFLFTMIDLKLVKNVLQMLAVSTSQLNWCKDKLSHIETRGRKLYRVQEDTHFFPSSCS